LLRLRHQSGAWTMSGTV